MGENDGGFLAAAEGSRYDSKSMMEGQGISYVGVCSRKTLCRVASCFTIPVALSYPKPREPGENLGLAQITTLSLQQH